MTPTQYRTVVDFETTLQPGTPVLVRWTAGSAGHYKAQATVKRVNGKSVRVTLTEAVETPGWGTYPVGREIVVPLLSNIDRWTYFNRVEPANGYGVEA